MHCNDQVYCLLDKVSPVESGIGTQFLAPFAVLLTCFLDFENTQICVLVGNILWQLLIHWCFLMHIYVYITTADYFQLIIKPFCLLDPAVQWDSDKCLVTELQIILQQYFVQSCIWCFQKVFGVTWRYIKYIIENNMQLYTHDTVNESLEAILNLLSVRSTVNFLFNLNTPVSQS